MNGQEICFLLHVEDQEWERMVFGNSADVKVCPWALNVGSVVYMRFQVKTHVPDP